MVSSWLPPVMVSTLVTVSVLLPAEDRVTLSVPAPRLTVPLVIAVPSATVSAPVPPVMVSMLRDRDVLAPVARVSLSVPAPRSTMPPAIAAPSVMVSARCRR